MDMVTRRKLEMIFTNRDDKFWGVAYDEDGVSKFMRNGFSGTQCTGFATEVVSLIMTFGWEGVVTGFLGEDNPTAAVGQIAGGHDFAMVQKRFIVDPWLAEVAGGRITTHSGKNAKSGDRIVFDLLDPYDKGMIARLYGDRTRWSITPPLPQNVRSYVHDA